MYFLLLHQSTWFQENGEHVPLWVGWLWCTSYTFRASTNTFSQKKSCQRVGNSLIPGQLSSESYFLLSTVCCCHSLSQTPLSFLGICFLLFCCTNQPDSRCMVNTHTPMSWLVLAHFLHFYSNHKHFWSSTRPYDPTKRLEISHSQTSHSLVTICCRNPWIGNTSVPYSSVSGCIFTATTIFLASFHS